MSEPKFVGKESKCNGCPDCIGCGRSREFVYWYECDGCKGEFEYFELEEYEGEFLCEDCIAEREESEEEE